MPERDEPPEPGEQDPRHRRSPEPPETEPSGRDRLLRALRRPSRAQVAVAVLLAILGYAGVTQVRSTELDDTYEGYRQQDLIDVLTGLAGASERAEREIARLERTRDRLRSDTSAREAAIEQEQEEVDTLAILAGVVPATGPGLRITIHDPAGGVDINTLLDTIQELRSAGAEAIEFNDKVRFVAQSHFEDTGGVVTVDGTPLRPPYVIDVIGEPHTLRGALTFPEGPIDAVDEEGGSVEVVELEEVGVESVRDPAPQQYAEPAPEQ